MERIGRMINSKTVIKIVEAGQGVDSRMIFPGRYFLTKEEDAFFIEPTEGGVPSESKDICLNTDGAKKAAEIIIKR